MEAALKIFARRGLIGTKMSMISAEAGISQGLMYRYFTSKDELFIKLIERAMNDSVTGIRKIYQIPGSPMEKLKVLTDIILEEDGQLYFLLIHHARTSDEVPEAVKKLLSDYSMEKYIKLLEPLILEGQQLGEIVEGDYREIISNYFIVLSGLMTLDIHHNDDYQMPKTEFLLRMMEK
ncbi:TetR/AcrR family transcriptional regulator [Metabacillus sp. RGM 3146]|uniref:TetR/AcrR family transcriptional regulator n=1 Tax=Metabacillus sp. RGM 3146 TaxID=3401092 RepID=UPI003B9AC1EB